MMFFFAHRVADLDSDELRLEATELADGALISANAAATSERTALVVERQPTNELLDRSGDLPAVVVGRRGTGGLKHRELGSVSQHLATHSNGPVVVVPATWESTRCGNIIVGFDGSKPGPRDVGSVARTFLASVSTWLLHDAPGPVAVVPEPQM
ncbi:MAG: nucleotide-binding universal stress UspA family protein [Ilumatobacter sp.]|jgi:nucleotide-binding universal stress UspA family protein